MNYDMPNKFTYQRVNSNKIKSKRFAGGPVKFTYEASSYALADLKTDIIPKRSEDCLYRRLHLYLLKEDPKITYHQVRAKFLVYFFTRVGGMKSIKIDDSEDNKK